VELVKALDNTHYMKELQNVTHQIVDDLVLLTQPKVPKGILNPPSISIGVPSSHFHLKKTQPWTWKFRPCTIQTISN